MRLSPWEHEVRLFVYRHFVAACRAPSVLETAQSLSVGLDRVWEAFSALAEKHVLVLQPGSGDVWMAMPFSAIPTTYRVIQGESSWWAN
jgi:hypothetical protein